MYVTNQTKLNDTNQGGFTMKKATPVQINWKPDKNNPVPLYQQIVDYIYQKISSGDWPVGTRLPSQRALAEQFDVNRSTITSALDELTAFGIIRSGHGAGTLVINNTWGLMLPEFQKWEKYVTSGSFMENNQTIQTINRMEFEENIIRLGTGELDPRIFPKDKWNQVLRNLTPQIQSLGYLGPLGLPELQEALARHLASCGIHTSPSNILVTSGALQALQLISVALLKPGSTVYTEAPSCRYFNRRVCAFSGFRWMNTGFSIGNYKIKRPCRADITPVFCIRYQQIRIQPVLQWRREGGRN